MAGPRGSRACCSPDSHSTSKNISTSGRNFPPTRRMRKSAATSPSRNRSCGLKILPLKNHRNFLMAKPLEINSKNMKTKTVSAKYFLSALALGTAFISASTNAADSPTNVAPDTILFHDGREIRAPAALPAPRINGPAIFGVRPDHPFLYHIPATGDRPMEFSADKLPAGLTLDSKTGDITGTIHKKGEYKVTLHAKNSLGMSDKKFKIVGGETIALTPPLGWNSWNHYAGRVTGDIILQNAKAMADSGLINHGWNYMNIDDTWQGARGGQFNGIQGNEKFPDMKALCDGVHALGLKIGIYSTPWTTSYATQDRKSVV